MMDKLISDVDIKSMIQQKNQQQRISRGGGGQDQVLIKIVEKANINTERWINQGLNP